MKLVPRLSESLGNVTTRVKEKQEKLPDPLPKKLNLENCVSPARTIKRGMPLVCLLCLLTLLPVLVALGGSVPTCLLHLIEIDPGHSHLSGLHSMQLPGVSDDVHIYSPLTPELASHLAAISSFNARTNDPTHWKVRLLAGPDFLQQFQAEPPGQIVALSGRNVQKIDYILGALQKGQHVFADKPWIITQGDFGKLEAAVQLAQNKHLITYDWMTLRGNTAYQLVRDLIRDSALFGQPLTGSKEHPAVHLQNLHALLKFSDGIAQRRPPTFLNVRANGEGMADVGTHLADLVQWTLFPNRTVSYRKDIQVLSADHAPLAVTVEQFTRLTGLSAFPSYLQPDLVNNQLQYLGNGSCLYTLFGVHVKLDVRWQYEAPKGAQDSYLASYNGTRATVELRAGATEHYIPEIYVLPASGTSAQALQSTLQHTVASLRNRYSGLSMVQSSAGFHVILPAGDRSGDDLDKIFELFAGYVRNYSTFPESENANLLAKYYVTTTAVAMANTPH